MTRRLILALWGAALMVAAPAVAAPSEDAACPVWTKPSLTVEEKWADLQRRIAGRTPTVVSGRPGKDYCLAMWRSLEERGLDAIVAPDAVARSKDDPALVAALGKCAGHMDEHGEGIWSTWYYAGDTRKLPPSIDWHKTSSARLYYATGNFSVTRVPGKNGPLLVADADGWCAPGRGYISPDYKILESRSCQWTYIGGFTYGYGFIFSYEGNYYISNISSSSLFIMIDELSLRSRKVAKFCHIDFVEK